MRRRRPLLQRTPLRSRSTLRRSRPGRSPRPRARRPAHTQAEDAHLLAVAELGCLACLLDGWDGTPAEIHHSRLRPDGQTYGTSARASHFEVIPLCPAHHRGGKPGVLSRHLHEADFVARYGDDLHLLELVRRLLSVED